MMRRVLAIWAVLVVAAGSALAEGNWPQFRGPAGDGHVPGKGLPLTWSETEHVTWKVPVHDRGWSSPVIWGEQIWLTTATEDGRKLYALCLDKTSGKVLYDKQLFDIEDPQFAHKFNSYASPTPVIEEGRVYITFGSPGTACIDTKSFKTLWTREDIECNHFRGAGSSPILYDGLLIMNFDGSDHQFILALDKATGKTVWRKERSLDYMDIDPKTGKPEADGDWRKAFGTPHVAQLNGKTVLLSQGAKASYGYNPKTGEEYWRFEERGNHSAATRPVVGDGLIFLATGFPRPILAALKPGAEGLVGEDHVAWTLNRGIPKKPSLTLVGDLLIMIEDGGIATCVDARTGEQYWNERVRGNYSASPVCADGRMYFSDENGKTTVVKAAKEFEVLATNDLEDGMMSSLAASGKTFFLRTKTHLYRIEE